ncbi:MAG: CysS/YqeB C-terminal domain-containing protein, partial [Halothece sp.]
SDEEVQALIEKRAVARQEKNFSEADRIRDELTEKGVVLIDQPGGETRWYWDTH